MKVLLDTSVLIAALVVDHEHHGRAFPWLRGGIDGSHGVVVSAHTLAEVYAVVTRLPLPLTQGPSEARELIRRSIEDTAHIVALSAKDYREVLDVLAQRQFTGGRIYDALIVKTGLKARVDHIITLNVRHFSGIWPEADALLRTP